MGDIVLTEVEKAYIAGIVDGEGYISIINRRPGADYCVQLGIANTSDVLLVWLSRKLGVNVSAGEVRGSKLVFGGKYKPLYRIVLHGQKAQEVVRAIRPYLIVKASVADNMLAFPVGSFGRSLTEDIKSRRTVCYVLHQILMGKLTWPEKS